MNIAASTFMLMSKYAFVQQSLYISRMSLWLDCNCFSLVSKQYQRTFLHETQLVSCQCYNSMLIMRSMTFFCCSIILLACKSLVQACGSRSSSCSYQVCHASYQAWSPWPSNGQCIYQYSRVRYSYQTIKKSSGCPGNQGCHQRDQGRTYCKYKCDVIPFIMNCKQEARKAFKEVRMYFSFSRKTYCNKNIELPQNSKIIQKSCTNNTTTKWFNLSFYSKLYLL